MSNAVPPLSETAALYEAHYTGALRTVKGALYVGHGVVAGLNENGIRTEGTYTVSGRRLFWRLSLTAPAGTKLITGHEAHEETTWLVGADWSVDDLQRGRPQTMLLEEEPVTVVLNKLQDLP